MFKILLPCLLWTSFAFAAVSPEELEKAIQLPVEKYTLKNGLTVLLHPDRSIPSISLQQWFKVGSKDEIPGRTGLAHFFEHMMFKGTKKFGPETWSRTLNSKGAEVNAFTSNDYTGYYINIPSENMELALQIEADRMRNLVLDPKDVNSEREVVKEERRMRYDDSIEGGMREKMVELMFQTLPYKWLPIGFMKDLNEASMDDFRAFYKTYYSPGNAVLVLAGDFDTEQAKKIIEKNYGKIPKEEIKRPSVTAEPEQKAVRRAVIEREAQAPSIAIGYRLPELSNKDHYALDLLSIVLGQGQSSRLYKQMVEKKELTLNIGSSAWGQVYAGSFMISSTLKPKSNPDKVLALVENEVKLMRDKKVTQKELDKARNIFLKDYVDGMKRISGRARMLANYEILFGDYRRVFHDLKEYQSVTADDIKRVAALYLQPSQRNIIVVQPRKAGGPK